MLAVRSISHLTESFDEVNIIVVRRLKNYRRKTGGKVGGGSGVRTDRINRNQLGTIKTQIQLQAKRNCKAGPVLAHHSSPAVCPLCSVGSDQPSKIKHC